MTKVKITSPEEIYRRQNLLFLRVDCLRKNTKHLTNAITKFNHDIMLVDARINDLLDEKKDLEDNSSEDKNPAL